jgi:hypothetical protein
MFYTLSALQEALENFIQGWQQRRREAARRPEVLRKWYTWESVRGKRVQVYYVPSRIEAQEITRIVQGCDETLQQIAALLDIKLTGRPVPVFLYPDDHAFRRCEQIQGLPCVPAISRGGSISLTYGVWSSIAKIIAHELTHVISQRYCRKPLIMLLDEGLAKYVADWLYPDAERVLTPRLDQPLHRLANHNILWECMEDHEGCREAYAHVHAFAAYLINRHGMEAFLKVLKASADRKWQQREKRFTVAVQKIYGLTVEDLEFQWRRENAIR